MVIVPRAHTASIPTSSPSKPNLCKVSDFIARP
jgi:hypothetical protein